MSVRVEEKYPKINNKTGCERREEERETIRPWVRRRGGGKEGGWRRGDKKEERKRKVRGRVGLRVKWGRKEEKEKSCVSNEEEKENWLLSHVEKTKMTLLT